MKIVKDEVKQSVMFYQTPVGKLSDMVLYLHSEMPPDIPDSVRMIVEGRLVDEAADAFAEEVMTLAPRGHYILLDFTGVSSVSALCADRLIILHQRLERDGRLLSVHGVSDALYRDFREAGMPDMLRIYRAEKNVQVNPSGAKVDLDATVWAGMPKRQTILLNLHTGSTFPCHVPSVLISREGIVSAVKGAHRKTGESYATLVWQEKTYCLVGHSENESIFVNSVMIPSHYSYPLHSPSIIEFGSTSLLYAVGRDAEAILHDRKAVILEDMRTGEIHLMTQQSTCLGRLYPWAKGAFTNDGSISREHAVIHYDGVLVQIQDQSSNGTVLNGCPIGYKQLVPLHDGDRIGIGSVSLKLHVTELS